MAIKRKRGRPKGSKNKPKVPSTETVKSAPKKKDSLVSSEPKKKRGRPRKVDQVEKKFSRNVSKSDDIDMSNVKTFKFLGYCPKCEAMIGSTDLEEGKKTIFRCGCGKRARVKLLKLSRNVVGDRPKTKKEFLEQTIDVNDYGFVPKYKDEIPTELKEVEQKDEWN